VLQVCTVVTPILPDSKRSTDLEILVGGVGGS